jgi:hypothetical protein
LHVGSGSMLSKKSFGVAERNFQEPPVRFVRNGVRDRVAENQPRTFAIGATAHPTEE